MAVWQYGASQVCHMERVSWSEALDRSDSRGEGVERSHQIRELFKEFQ